MKKIIVIILLSLLFSCAFNLPIVRTVQVDETIIKNYEIGKPYNSNIGEPFISAQRGVFQSSYIVVFDYQPPRFNEFFAEPPMLLKGQEFSVIGYTQTEKGEGVLISNEIYINEIWKRSNIIPTLNHSTSISITPDGYIQYGWRTNDGSVFRGQEGNWTDNKLFEINQKNYIISPESFRFEIIYLGRDGNTIRAKYREYSSNLARDAFSQDLTWNLDESKILTYRTIKAEVIKATNSSLELKVLEDGGLTWLP